jgi:hypothetical protein
MSQPIHPPGGVRRWPRRLAISFLALVLIVAVLGVTFYVWVLCATVPVMVVDAEGRPVNGAAVFGTKKYELIDSMRRPAGVVYELDLERSALADPAEADSKQAVDWREKMRTRLHRWTRLFGIGLVWDKDQPIYTNGAGGAHVPAASPDLIAISLGDIKHQASDSFVVETLPGKRGWGSPATIVVRRPTELAGEFEKKVTWSYVETPLQEVIAAAEKETGRSIVLDRSSLAEEGISPDTPVSIRVTDISVRSALRILLAQYNLTFLCGSDAIRITSKLTASGDQDVRLYPVDDLLSLPASRSARPGDELRNVVVRLAAPQTWSTVGGPGDIAIFETERVMIVSQEPAVHAQIEQVLAALRSNSDRMESAKESLIRRELAERVVSIDASETQLSDIIDELREQVDNWSFVLDKPAMAQDGIDSDTAVTLRAGRAKLATALEQLLQPLNLTTVVQNDVLLVTTQTRVVHEICARFSPVTELVHDSNEAEALSRRIQAKIDPSGWLAAGGRGDIYYFAPTDCLIVTQTEAVQHLVKSFLDKSVRERDNPAR